MPKHKVTVADGFAPELIAGAQLESFFDIPCLEPVKELIVPQGLIPFSKRKRSRDHREFVAFYEHDVKFADFVLRPEFYSEELCRFRGVITPDCSLYRGAAGDAVTQHLSQPHAGVSMPAARLLCDRQRALERRAQLYHLLIPG